MDLNKKVSFKQLFTEDCGCFDKMKEGGSIDHTVNDIFFKWDEVFDNNREGITQGRTGGKQRIFINMEGLPFKDGDKFIAYLRKKKGVEFINDDPAGVEYTIEINK